MPVLLLVFLGAFMGIQPTRRRQKQKQKESTPQVINEIVVVEDITSEEGKQKLDAFYTISEAIQLDASPYNMQLFRSARSYVVSDESISDREKLDVDIVYVEIMYSVNTMIATQFQKDLAKFRAGSD